jgi:ketosteroid isomerase-like protein
MAGSDEAQVRTVIENWAKAVSAGDREGILANHSEDLLMFDFPATIEGLHAYDRSWDFFYANPRGTISFVPREIAVTAGDDVAFATCIVDCDGTSAGPLDFRLTTGLRKVRGQWTIVHEHHSLATEDEQYIDQSSPEGGKGA